MANDDDLSGTTQVVRATREVRATPETIFELIADPARQPEWDGNDNLGQADAGQRVREVGDVFRMVLLGGDKVRENHVVEFEEGRLIAWRPASEGEAPAGHLWRWELEPTGGGATRVTQTYDWTQLTDESRMARARSTSPAMLQASLDRLAELAEATELG
ncbi:SRPBCC family protein [Barrientosiimonas humi]|uniref:SRPBCC family protein n=1 Tax=Barrientosiimonas humi TaxID=999931 RepID=UPI00370D637C